MITHQLGFGRDHIPLVVPQHRVENMTFHSEFLCTNLDLYFINSCRVVCRKYKVKYIICMDANVNCIKLKQTNKVSLFYVYKNIDMQVLFTLIVGNFFFWCKDLCILCSRDWELKYVSEVSFKWMMLISKESIISSWVKSHLLDYLECSNICLIRDVVTVVVPGNFERYSTLEICAHVTVWFREIVFEEMNPPLERFLFNNITYTQANAIILHFTAL